MDYCQKQYLDPYLIEGTKKLLFICPLGKHHISIDNRNNEDSVEYIISKVEPAMLKGCEECPLCDVIRNDRNMIDSAISCVKNTYLDLKMRKITNPIVANYIGKFLYQFVWAAHYLKHWNEYGIEQEDIRRPEQKIKDYEERTKENEQLS